MDRGSPIHDVSKKVTISWLTSDKKQTVGVMTMQDDHRLTAATYAAIPFPYLPPALLSMGKPSSDINRVLWAAVAFPDENFFSFISALPVNLKCVHIQSSGVHLEINNVFLLCKPTHITLSLWFLFYPASCLAIQQTTPADPGWVTAYVSSVCTYMCRHTQLMSE